MNKKILIQNNICHLKQSQSGMTLLEVIVAMIVLAIGVLALLATQLKSVSSVREAESQTIVSQIVQNLTEGMLINPTLSAGAGLANKSYSEYLRSSVGVSACRPSWGNNMSKTQLATAQLCQFSNSLATALPDAKINYTVCQDRSDAEPTVTTNAINFNCTGNGDYVVKVVWQMDTEETKENYSSLKMNGSKVVYSYQSRITQ